MAMTLLKNVHSAIFTILIKLPNHSVLNVTSPCIRCVEQVIWQELSGVTTAYIDKIQLIQNFGLKLISLR